MVHLGVDPREVYLGVGKRGSTCTHDYHCREGWQGVTGHGTQHFRSHFMSGHRAMLALVVKFCAPMCPEVENRTLAARSTKYSYGFIFLQEKIWR